MLALTFDFFPDFLIGAIELEISFRVGHKIDFKIRDFSCRKIVCVRWSCGTQLTTYKNIFKFCHPLALVYLWVK